MVNDGAAARTLARYLLQIKAIQIQSANPFQWASGWLSPIYCDNRKTLSHPKVRNFIKSELTSLINSRFKGIDMIAGVATGAIALGALIADELSLPFVYVRSASKGHGLQNLVEGDLSQGSRIVVVEDLVSTGKSSLSAVEALRNAGKEVTGMASIFDYGFEKSASKFREMDCALYSLCDYSTLIDEALETSYVESGDLPVLKNWRVSPETWTGK